MSDGMEASRLREINLEEGKPFVEQAIKHLSTEIKRSKDMGCSVLKIIHGYGSSGAGGRIRTEARKFLEQLMEKGEIMGFIPGESFTIFNEATRIAFTRCTALRRDPDLERYNNGVTFIVL